MLNELILLAEGNGFLKVSYNPNSVIGEVFIFEIAYTDDEMEEKAITAWVPDESAIPLLEFLRNHLED